jgi:hypothetical protein
MSSLWFATPLSRRRRACGLTQRSRGLISPLQSRHATVSSIPCRPPRGPVRHRCRRKRASRTSTGRDAQQVPLFDGILMVCLNARLSFTCGSQGIAVLALDDPASGTVRPGSHLRAVFAAPAHPGPITGPEPSRFEGIFQAVFLRRSRRVPNRIFRRSWLFRWCARLVFQRVFSG